MRRETLLAATLYHATPRRRHKPANALPIILALLAAAALMLNR